MGYVLAVVEEDRLADVVHLVLTLWSMHGSHPVFPSIEHALLIQRLFRSAVLLHNTNDAKDTISSNLSQIYKGKTAKLANSAASVVVASSSSNNTHTDDYPQKHNKNTQGSRSSSLVVASDNSGAINNSSSSAIGHIRINKMATAPLMSQWLNTLSTWCHAHWFEQQDEATRFVTMFAAAGVLKGMN